MSGNAKFATLINCMDGRVQESVVSWLKNRFQVDYVDVITEPGPDKILLEMKPMKLADIKKKIDISINKHHSKVIAIAGHYDCAGNPVSQEEHLIQIKKCVDLIKSWNLGVAALGLWVNEKWEVEKVVGD